MKFVVNTAEAMRLHTSGGVSLRGAADVRLTLGSSGSIGSNDSNFIRAATDQIIYNSATSSGRHSFELAGVEKMRITSSGNLGINTTSPTSYANSQATLVIEDDTNPAICWSDTGQTRDWWAVANGAGLSFNYADGGGSGSASNVTQVLSMDNSGFVGIGTSPTRRLHVHEAASGVNAYIQLTNANSGTGSGDGLQFIVTDSDALIVQRENLPLDFRTNDIDRMRIHGNGYIYMYSVYSNAVAGSYRDVYVESNGFVGYLSSIQAHKTNIAPIEDVDWLYSLNPVSFNRKKKDEQGAYTDEFHEENEYGLIAEQVEPVAPQLCFYDTDEETGENTLAGVHYRQLIAPMLKALQDAKACIKTLETQNADLTARITALETA